MKTLIGCTFLAISMLVAETTWGQSPNATEDSKRGAATSQTIEDPNQMSREELTATIKRLDAELFDAYNRCELQKFAAFFPEQLEFYHDQTGGGPMTREQLVAAIRQNICGKVHREAVSIEVYPMKNFWGRGDGRAPLHASGDRQRFGNREVRALVE